MEWPTACAYWRWKCVENLVEMLGLKPVKVHGCALGLRSVVNGMPIKKPWTLKTDVPTIVEELEKYTCPGNHEHTPCAGKDTKLTESYTPEMVAVVHRAFKKFLSGSSNSARLHKHVNAAVAVIRTTNQKLVNLSRPSSCSLSNNVSLEQPRPLGLGCKTKTTTSSGTSMATFRVDLEEDGVTAWSCLLYTSPSPRD